MASVLKPFQQTGAEFLAERTRALLGDEPGVGKTAQFITACNLVGAGRVGVVAPSIGLEHWRREFDKWSFQGYRADIISWGDAHEMRDTLAAAGGPKRLPMQWDVLIADEVHFGKNPQARRTKAVLGTGGLSWYARRIWAGSGTPAPNNAAELWPLLRAFDKTKMDLQAFTNYFCVVDGRGKVRGNRQDHIAELRGILKTFTLRRLKKDVLPELGPIDIQEWYVTPNARFTWDTTPDVYVGELHKRLARMSDDEVMAFLASGDEDFSTLRRYNALLKAPAVFDTVKFELENGLLDKIVIYGHHKEALAALDREFKAAGIGSILIDGDTPMKDRDGLIERWKKDGQVLLASITVAGTAVDLTAAHQGIMVELDWVNANNAQAMQRMHRHGQQNPVTIRIAIGTPVDEIITSVLVRKARDTHQLLDARQDLLPEEPTAITGLPAGALQR